MSKDAAADTPVPTPVPTPFHELDHFVHYPRVGSLAVSRDGSKLVAGVATLNSKGTKWLSALWSIDPTGEQSPTRLTRSMEGESGPVFAANGDLLFSSARPGPDGDDEKSAALWLIPANGGEARIVLRRAGGIGSVTTADDADITVVRAAVLPGSDGKEQDAQLRQNRGDSNVNAILHSSYPVRFWDHDLGPDQWRLFALEAEEQTSEYPSTVDGTSKAVLRDVTPDIGRGLFEGAEYLSPDGSTLLVSEYIVGARGAGRSALLRIDVASGKRERILDDPDVDYGPGPFSPDGQRAVIVAERRSDEQNAADPKLYVLDVANGTLEPLAHGWPLRGNPEGWLPDGSGVVVTADFEGRSPIFVIDAQTSAVRRVTEDDFAYTSVVLDAQGTVFALQAGVAKPNEPVRVDLASGEVTPLLSPVDRPKLPGRLEEVRTQAEDGTPLRAWLAVPESASDSAPAPLLLWIHGGPVMSWNSWSWRWCPWIMVAQGYAVLLPDPALSTGYGQDFIQRGYGSWGDKPFTDLMTITDAVEQRSDIDAERTAAMGGSFGGYMSNWVAGHTDRFKAIVTHASLWALDSFSTGTDMGFYWGREMTERMIAENSPHLSVGEIRTPMLVIHGDKDYRVPIHEGLRLWYDLISRSGLPMDDDGKTPHRFLYFPDENHWVLTPNHAKIWYQVITAFLADHVLEETVELPAVLAADDPTLTTASFVAKDSDDKPAGAKGDTGSHDG